MLKMSFLRLDLDQEAFARWVAVDDLVETGPSGSVEEIVEEVKNKFQEEEEDSDEEIEIEEPKIPNSEAFAAVEFLKKFYLQRDNSSANLLALDRMKRELENQMTYSQPTLESFIQK